MAKVPVKYSCARCEGKGFVSTYTTCNTCIGKGYIFHEGEPVACSHCEGESHVRDGLEPCPECKGLGFQVVMEAVGKDCVRYGHNWAFDCISESTYTLKDDPDQVPHPYQVYKCTRCGLTEEGV